jgi:hypothetical protein
MTIDEAVANHRREMGQDAGAFAALSKEILSYFETVAAQAQISLSGSHPPSVNTLVHLNTIAAPALRNLAEMSAEVRKSLAEMLRRPAIARLEVLDDNDEPRVIFITTGGGPGLRWPNAQIASYRSPIGRLAAIRVGDDDDIRTPSGIRNFQLTQRARLNPSQENMEWDSRDTVLEHHGTTPLTIVSLRRLLRALNPRDDDGVASLRSTIASDEDDIILDGLRRTQIERMGLRERPLLDQYQDEIFRLPLASRVALLGPPGSGKTTTLIKRLGLKLDLSEALEDLDVIGRTQAKEKGHAQSWLMFAPTELLRQYVKEAFAREGIAAPDHQIKTWEEYRKDVARNRLGLLQTNTQSGAVLRPDLDNLLDETELSQINWFEDFDNWQKQEFWADLSRHAARLRASTHQGTVRLGEQLQRVIDRTASRDDASAFVEFRRQSRALRTRAQELSSEVNEGLERLFAGVLRTYPQLLDQLAGFLESIATTQEVSEAGEDLESDDEDEEAPPPTKNARARAYEAYKQAVSAFCRALASGRKLPARSRPGRIVQWLGENGLVHGEPQSAGDSLLLALSLRRLANPMRAFLRGIPVRYRQFRRNRVQAGRWYLDAGHAANHLSPLELDLILLAVIRAGRVLLAERQIADAVDEDSISTLLEVRDLFRTQVVVDEATDFSPVQLACMVGFCDPAANAFMACGDFNQRITRWGARRDADLNWAVPNLELHRISITYRHSRQLNVFAHALAMLTDPGAAPPLLPEHLDNEGVDPVLGLALSGEALIRWLAERIGEIEALTRKLPSIAVLVNEEAAVDPLASDLRAALLDTNIPVEGCPRGLVRGADSAVRVFDVQHIKGLEFEAVFFVGVDKLAADLPDLFDKYLYVGATRAAMYLGLTMEGRQLPYSLSGLKPMFTPAWRARSTEAVA